MRAGLHRVAFMGRESVMSDIANAIYRHLRTMAPYQLERLTAIQLREAADEISRLKDALRRIAEQDAASACDGNVRVTMDATLTDLHRAAIEYGVMLCDDTAGMAYDRATIDGASRAADVLRGLLERQR